MGFNPFPPDNLADFLRLLSTSTKRRVFISYHHAGDQRWCDYLRDWYGDWLDVFTDRSLGEPVRSNDSEYVNRVIREEYITGTSVTIVLCGAETWKRKYVDWEIRSTLSKQHGLLGIRLPSCASNFLGSPLAPDRLVANYDSGYALWRDWMYGADEWKAAIDLAARQARDRPYAVVNGAPKMSRNR